jgi:hypothetical protein
MEEKTVEQNKEREESIKKILNKFDKLFGFVLTDDHYKLFRTLLENNDAGILLDIQSYFGFVENDNRKDIPKLIDELRKWNNVIVKNGSDCRLRLQQLRSKISSQEDNKLISDAIKLLELPDDSQCDNNSDYELMKLTPKMKTRRDVIEIQELFMYLNSMFEVIQPSGQEDNSFSNQKNKSKK